MRREGEENVMLQKNFSIFGNLINSSFCCNEFKEILIIYLFKFHHILKFTHLNKSIGLILPACGWMLGDNTNKIRN